MDGGNAAFCPLLPYQVYAVRLVHVRVFRRGLAANGLDGIFPQVHILYGVLDPEERDGSRFNFRIIRSPPCTACHVFCTTHSTWPEPRLSLHIGSKSVTRLILSDIPKTPPGNS